MLWLRRTLQQVPRARGAQEQFWSDPRKQLISIAAIIRRSSNNSMSTMLPSGSALHARGPACPPSCSPRCLPHPLRGGAPQFPCTRRHSSTAHNPNDPVQNPNVRAPVSAHSAAAASSAAEPLLFRSGRQRLSPLDRAAAAAHHSLHEDRQKQLSPASLCTLPGGQHVPRGGAVAPAALPRAGADGVRGPAPGAAGMEEDEEVDSGPTEEEIELDKRRRRFVGQLQGVPHVAVAQEQLGSARKKAAKVTPSAGIKNEAEKERNRAARRLDTLMKGLSVPLTRYVDNFPPPEKLHPFEQALLQLTVGIPLYRSTLQKVDRLRKAVQEVGKGAASRAANAPSKAAAIAAGEEGAEAVEAVFTAGAKHVDALKEIAKSLRSLPSLDTSLPTLALVGAPNVGKSSLVNVLSSGTPEVCNYPFTTRSIKMGHFYLDSQQHQVTDTPGLLRRPDSERNRMEQLTLAALGCLDTAVLFVVDLTEECGTSVGDQWAIRQEVRARFPERPWLDVLSKADMLQDVFAEADELIRSSREQQLPDAHTQPPTDPTTTTALANATAEPAGGGADDAAEAAVTPAEVAARLPAALRISSVTHDGIPQLQLAIIHMLRARARARAAEEAAREAAERQQRAAAAAARGPLLPQLPGAGARPPGSPPVILQGFKM